MIPAARRAAAAARPIPRDPLFDATLAFARDPYGYLSRRSRELDSDLFATRLLLRTTLCLTGEAGGRLFYDSECFQRHGAAPAPLQKTLLGEGGVQGLDGADHADRKGLLLDLLGPEDVSSLRDHTTRAWRDALGRWQARDEIELYAEVQRVLARAACAWAGMPLGEDEVETRTRELVALFDAAGSFGPRHLLARRARQRSEAWAAERIEAVRAGAEADPARALARIALHRGRDHERLPARIAAVELLNLLRPTVAISVYVVLVAHALHTHPAWRRPLDPTSADAFVQEVRRLYPFFPAVPAVVRRDFTWRGHRLRAGTRALFDLHGTNRDPRLWREPDAFRPERFAGAVPSPFALVPQGGGDPRQGHRCAGEGVTLALLKEAFRLLTTEMRYEVPPQDLRIARDRLPALPRSRLRLRAVRAA